MDISERIKNIEEEVANSISDLECFLQLLETEVQRFKSNIQGTGIKDQSVTDTLPLDPFHEVSVGFQLIV
ncbi:hypothetical protein HanHA89_Chr05g0197721 [Helianthus annuus]|nr:hypothetical protein HanHA89_Chr05g0197721 [Helianthus annuus]